MPRVTLSLSDREHLALKLLALNRKQKMVAVMKEALREYLEKEGAFDLSIQSDLS
jgi:predicted transcriptional regulator